MPALPGGRLRTASLLFLMPNDPARLRPPIASHRHLLARTPFQAPAAGAGGMTGREMEAVGWMTRTRKTAGCPAASDLLSDEEVMARVSEGDTAALALLFDRYRGRLFGFLYRMTGEARDAEDLVGATFVRLYECRRRFRRGHGFAPWIYRIARNLAIQELRHREAGRRATDRLGCEAAAAAPALPEEAAMRSELRSAVAAAVRSLPEEQRTAALLREYEGLNYREIGAVLGCSEEAARARTYRARLALRAALAGRLGEGEMG
jgi:RNA polymerase sigma-70 factor, ECF subfamily